MSARVTGLLQFAILSVSLVMGGVGLCSATFSTPARVDKLERELRELREERARDHDLLLRIEERLINVQAQLKGKL
jgi:hypothetical protein